MRLSEGTGAGDQTNLNSILVVGAHPDDSEIMAGGTLAKLCRQGAKVYSVVMSDGELGGDPNRRRVEAMESGKVLGFEKTFFCGFPDGRMTHDADVVHAIENILRETNPDIVITHTFQDSHQDHVNTCLSTLSAARRHPRILLGETPSSLLPPQGLFIVDISDTMEVKIKSLMTHRSVFCNQKGESILNHIKTTAAYRGHQFGVKYAEAFWVQRFLF